MYQDRSLTYRLAKNLKDHHYINLNNDILVTDEQIGRIQSYIDDIVFEQFFSLNKFKPMLVPKSLITHRYTNNGVISVSHDTYLDLNNPFDRYTFVGIVTSFNFFENVFMYKPDLFDFIYEPKRFGAIGHLMKRSIGNIRNPFFELLENDIQSILSIKNDLTRAEILSLYKAQAELKKRPHTINYTPYLGLIQNFQYIFDKPVFLNYTYGEILSIYCILVEKLRITETNLTSLLALILPDRTDINTCVIQQFHNFEKRVNMIFNEDMIDVRDLYLRFVSETKSRAFSFLDAESMDYVGIRLFDQEIVYAVDHNNTIPLPFYYSKVDKFRIQL